MDFFRTVKNYLFNTFDTELYDDAIKNYKKDYLILNATDLCPRYLIDKALNMYYNDLEIVSALLPLTENKEEVIKKILINKKNNIFIYIFTYIIKLDEKYVLMIINTKNIELLDFILLNGFKPQRIAEIAILLNEYTFVKALIFRGLDVTFIKTQILYLAAKNGDLDIVRKMINCDYSELLLMFYSIESNNISLVEFLVEYGIVIQKGMLYKAIEHDNKHILLFLLENSSYYEDIMDLAIQYKKYWIANIMLNKIDRLEYLKKLLKNKNFDAIDNLATDEEKKYLF